VRSNGGRHGGDGSELAVGAAAFSNAVRHINEQLGVASKARHGALWVSCASVSCWRGSTHAWRLNAKNSGRQQNNAVAYSASGCAWVGLRLFLWTRPVRRTPAYGASGPCCSCGTIIWSLSTAVAVLWYSVVCGSLLSLRYACLFHPRQRKAALRRLSGNHCSSWANSGISLHISYLKILNGRRRGAQDSDANISAPKRRTGGCGVAGSSETGISGGGRHGNGGGSAVYVAA